MNFLNPRNFTEPVACWKSAGGGLTLTTQDGTDHGPGWYYNSFPKTLREEYAKKWHVGK